MHALDHLTEDCWKEILKRVPDPKDLWSCSEACLTFQEILRKKRNQFMFYLILPLIKKYIPAPNPNPNDELALWRSLLKCRLVCKSWCVSVDKRRDAEEHHVFQQPFYQFNSGQVTDRFLQKFATHPGNLFLGRSVIVEQRTHLLLAGNQPEALNAYGEEEAFHIRKLRELMERFGNEIWNLDLVDSVDIEDIYDHKLSLCKNIQTVLGHLSHLRTLRLWFSFPRRMVTPAEVERKNMANHELTSYIAANPLPDLPKLEHMQVFCVNARMMRFILEKYSPNLSSLVLDKPRGFRDQGLQMTNLSKLEFTDLNPSTSLLCLRQLQAPKLGSLVLNVGRHRHRVNVEVWPIDELFRNIQHLPIRHLEVISIERDLFVGESAPIPPEQRAYHGSISSIYLNCPQGTTSFNFLLYCPQLTRIVLEHHSQGKLSGHPKGVPEALDVGSKLEQVERDFYQSNIWEHVPLLEHLKIGSWGLAGWKWDDYDRDEYEERKKQLAD